MFIVLLHIRGYVSFFLRRFAQRIQNGLKLSYNEVNATGIDILKFCCFPEVTSFAMIDCDVTY